MAEMLSELIETAAGFRAAVNLQQAQDDVEKAAAFLPTEEAAEVLFDLGRQLEPRAQERARLIMGTYGTGKSHLALVLTMLYRGRHEAVAPVLDRLAEKYGNRAATLKEQVSRIKAEAPYLVVLIEGDQGSFDAALVRGLRQALDRVGMTKYMPATYFSAAAARLRELLEDKEAAPRVEQAARAEGFVSATGLIERLESAGVQLEDLERFNRLHEQVCFGAPFHSEGRVSAVETYQDAARKLVEEGRFAGIVVIWDEFGAFMEQIVREPGAGEGLAVQRFAEACQDSGTNPLHLYLIAHRHLASYIRRVKDTRHLTPSQTAEWEQDFKKISGRFREFVMESKPEELYTLIDDVLIQKVSNGWEEFRKAHANEFVMLADDAYNAALFPDLGYQKLRERVVEGCFPLAPATAALLPRIAQLVAQNQRTLFTFLCGNHPGTVAHFLKETPVPGPGEPLPLIACDRLWDYFEQAIQEDRYGQNVYRRYRTALANCAQEVKDELGQRLLKVLALFELVREGDPERASELPAREEQLALALALRTEAERKQLRQRLEKLTSPGPSRVAVLTRDKVYRLISGPGAELEEEVEKLLAQRRPSLNVAHFVRQRWGWGSSKADQEFCLGFERSIEALTERLDVVSRTLEVVPLLPEEMENPHRWLKNIGGGEFQDGLLLLVLPTDDPHVGLISKRAQELADNPQVIVARPPRALQGLPELVARLDALEGVARQQAGLWGPQGERRDEWEVAYQDAAEGLRELLRLVELRPDARELHLDCYWQGSPHVCRSWGELKALADKAMGTAFCKTPHTTDEIMKPAKSRDGLAGARRAVVDKILDVRGPEVLLKEKDQAQARLVRLLQGFDMLKSQPKPHLDRPDPEADAGAAAIWDELQQFAQKLRQAPQEAMAIVKLLRGAPYGLGARVLPLVVAAALREPLRNGNIVAERRNRGDGWHTEAVNGAILDEALIGRPQDYRFRYVDVAEWQVRAIQGLIAALGGEESALEERPKLLAEAKHQVAAWWGRIPHYCQQTKTVSEKAVWLRDNILRSLLPPDADAYSVLIERLPQKLGQAQEVTRDQFKKVFAELLQEIETAVAALPQRVAQELREGLCLECEPEPAAVGKALRDWYQGLPAATREYCHPHDAGKLQSWLRTPEATLAELGRLITGKPLEQWADADVGYFVGRIQSAKQAIQQWTPPSPPPVVAAPVSEPGSVTLIVNATYKTGPLQITRRFPTIEPDDLSETAKVLLRLLSSNLAEDQSLRDGERENVLIQLIRRVFGDA